MNEPDWSELDEMIARDFRAWVASDIQEAVKRSKPYMETDNPPTEEPPDNFGKSIEVLKLEAENRELREKLHQVTCRLADMAMMETEEEAEPRKRAL